MSDKSHVDTGLRKILEAPSVYNLFQTLIGGKRHRREHFERYFQVESGVKILDIGCGTAVLLDYIEAQVDYHGCDMQQSYIDFASEKFSGRGNFYCERVGEKIREEWLGYFDVINAHGLLHHLSDEDSKALLEISHKYLRKGGRLVTVDTTFHEDQSRLSRWIVSKDRGQNLRTPEEYIKLGKEYFSKIEGKLDTKSLNIPFSIYTMELYK